jgi:hypothetical protein
MTRSIQFAVLVLSSSALCGCGGAPVAAKAPPAAPPHGGQFLPIPGDLGYVEILTEMVNATGQAPAKTRTSYRTRPDAEIVAYFFKPDGTTVVMPPPTGVILALQDERAGTNTVSLTPHPVPGDPTKRGRLASAAGPYADGAFSGELQATVDGQAVTIPINLR